MFIRSIIFNVASHEQKKSNILKQTFERTSQDRYFQGYLSSHETLLLQKIHYINVYDELHTFSSSFLSSLLM